jgi:hypothetical protein
MGAVKKADVLVMPTKGNIRDESRLYNYLKKLKYDLLDIYYIYSFFNKMIIGGVETTSMNSLTDIAN